MSVEDEKLKAILKLQKAIESDSVSAAIERASAAARSIDEAVRSSLANSNIHEVMKSVNAGIGLQALDRSLFENAGMNAVMESIRRHEEVTRVAFGPLLELQRSGASDVALAKSCEMEEIRRTVQPLSDGDGVIQVLVTLQ